MANENLKVGDVLTLKEFECLLNQVGVQSVFNQANHFINGLFFNGIIKTLAQSAFQIGLSRKQSRIELLESAIREFLRSEANEDTADDWIDSLDAKQKLRDIMEQAK